MFKNGFWLLKVGIEPFFFVGEGFFFFIFQMFILDSTVLDTMDSKLYKV